MGSTTRMAKSQPNHIGTPWAPHQATPRTPSAPRASKPARLRFVRSKIAHHKSMAVANQAVPGIWPSRLSPLTSLGRNHT